MKKFFLLLLIANLFFGLSNAQSVSINNDGLPPNASAILDIRSADKGLLIPRIALSSTHDTASVPTPATSLLIYNTVASGVGDTAVAPGYYYWNGALWLMLSTGPASGSPAGTSWGLAGNAGTDTAVNFLGTTDNKALQFKVNGIRAGYIGVASNDGNVFWGFRSGLNNRGYSNVGLGMDALLSNTDVSNLVAVGDSTLFHNTEGTENTAMGSKSLFSNLTGFGNTASGSYALNSNTIGTVNTANGASALY